MKTPADTLDSPNETQSHDAAAVSSGAVPRRREVYQAPRIEKRRAVARVTLLSGGGMSMATGGVFGGM
jgi:hypothetical protein